MRVRIRSTPPAEYGIDPESLRIGRVYNLDPSLASALMLEGCAELYDLLTPAERRAGERIVSEEGWRPARRRGRIGEA